MADGMTGPAQYHPGQLISFGELSPKEARQVRTANVLLAYTIIFATMASFYGIAMWVEHPDTIVRHHWVGGPSI